MIKVITYGTYDLLHYGHIKLLERAKALGDYLIVGVTADDFDKARGKFNVQQSLMERIEAVRATGLADEIIVEEYEGQKIDDIKKYDIDIFTVGSVWKGKFDYLKEFCDVVYLDRTVGISSSEIRAKNKEIKLGLIGDALFLNKIYCESKYVNGLKVNALLSNNSDSMNSELIKLKVNTFSEIIDKCDAIYIRSHPNYHYEQIKLALEHRKHVLCESPITLSSKMTRELYNIASKNNVILMDAIKTAYATAFSRLLLLVKGGKIGDIVSVDATCTSLTKGKTDWPGFYEWSCTALLPIFELLGTNSKKVNVFTHFNNNKVDDFTKIDIIYDNAIGTIKVGDGIKSEGQLLISGTNGYIYVPSPWWKTDYFEIRYENQEDNKRMFFQLDGEGIRYELFTFLTAVNGNSKKIAISHDISEEISYIMEIYCNKLKKDSNVV